MEQLKLKIPPPAWFLLCAGLMWLIASPEQIPHWSVWLFSGVVGSTGAIIALWAVFTFHQANTTHSPFSPEKTTKIITNGIYAKSRNPMYLALLLELVAWALWLGSIWAWWGLPLFVWLITYFQIKPEEHILAEKFGQPFLAYQAKVRRWI